MRFSSDQPEGTRDSQVIELQLGSDAYGQLWATLDQPGTYRVQIAARRDGIAIKRNHNVWSPTLSCEARPARPPEQPRSTIETVTGDTDQAQHRP